MLDQIRKLSNRDGGKTQRVREKHTHMHREREREREKSKSHRKPQRIHLTKRPRQTDTHTNTNAQRARGTDVDRTKSLTQRPWSYPPLPVNRQTFIVSMQHSQRPFKMS